MSWQKLLTGIKLLVVLLSFITVVAPEWPAFQNEQRRLNALVNLREFDFLVWGADALLTKLKAEAGGGHSFLDEATRRETVLAYLDLVHQIGQLRGEITAVFADPAILDPDTASLDLQRQLALRRSEMERLQPIAEAIIQEQVATVLAEQGFGTFSSVWPPIKMHMTPLPLVLIVSPREEIKQLYNIPLQHGLTITEREKLERATRQNLNRSALVVPIGGMGMYPAMIIETSNVNFLADVVAHEWAHHWLTLRPLGFHYMASPELRTINETAASIVGREIGAAVIERYYPEFVPPETPVSESPSTASREEANAAPAFNFLAEMADTRVRVDELLAQGKVDEAEAYMEEQRQVFVHHGYPIRKLNQAYFAFYGAYADTPGATGADPVGPTVVALREQSPSLYAFMETIAQVTSFDTLKSLVDDPPVAR